ncbi:MAG TPA: glycosyltransferase WbuB [Erythrobacter sp.]|nr:glycosyltransferase WbuB [Erythrobacter sp.]
MRILLISQWFQPEPTFKGLEFAKALRALGHDVEVLTGFPNYPGGTVYSGYRLRLFQREIMDGIIVTRGYLYPSHDQSALRRIANYISFAISTSLLAIFQKKPDVVYVYTPPMTAALPAVILRIFRKVPYVVDIQDLWPDTLAATGMVNSLFILKLVGYWTDFALRHAGRVIVLSDGFRQRLEQRGVVNPLTVIPNWAPPEIALMTGKLPVRQDPDPRFRVLFAGNMGNAQGLDVVIGAAELLEERGVQVRFDMIGGGVDVERLKSAAASRAPDMIRFHAARHPSEMGEMFAEADALLVHLRSDPLFDITIPSKTQAYLAIGKPILMGVRGEAARMVEEAQAGIAFEPDCAKALADAIYAMLAMSVEKRNQLGRAGQSYYQDKLAFDVGVAAIAKELEFAAVAGVSKPSRADP